MSTPKLVKICEHTLVPEYLDESGLVIDCGVGVGDFARELRRLTQAKIVGVEADPQRFAQIPLIENAQFSNLALWTHEYGIELKIANDFCSSAVYEPIRDTSLLKVPSTTLEEVVRESGAKSITLIKMDIEGAELNVLEQVSPGILENTTQVSVEFHDFINGADLPRIQKIIQKMKLLNFEVLKFSTWTHGDILFLNRKRVSLSRLDCFNILIKGRFLPGISRFLKRRLRVPANGIA